jgi:Flp pilus assembly protein TadD
MNLALALAAAGRLSDAEREYRTGITLAPADAAMHSGLGRVLAAEGRRDEAVELFTRALQLGPSDPRVREDIAAATGR